MERDIDEAAEQMKGKESIEQLQAVKPTAEQIQPYVGTWRGTSGTVGGESMDTLLVITVKDGQAPARSRPWSTARPSTFSR